uniref:tetratricopeptide repeat protein n=1 Tax=Sandarakinorhabdus sp. TaxID=1916663 RepID=UPI00286E0AEF
MRTVFINGLATTLAITAAAPTIAATALPAALQARLAISAAAMADPDSIEPSRQVDLARAHLTLCVEAWGPASPQTAQCELELGRALLVEMFPVEAKSVLTNAIAHLGPAPDPQQRAQAQSVLGEALEMLSEYDAAETLLVAALAVQTAPADRAVTLRRYATVLIRKARFAEAETALVAARAATASAGKRVSVHNQANLLLASGLLGLERERGGSAGQQYLSEALSLMEGRFGKFDSRLGRVLELLGATTIFRGALAAEPWMERSLAVERARPRPNPDRLGSALADLGAIFGGSGRHAQGVALQQEALALALQTGTKRSFAIRSLKLVNTLRGAGRTAEALPIMEAGTAAAVEVWGKSHPQVAIFLGTLSELYGLAGKPDEAIAAAREAVRISAASIDPANNQGIYAHVQLGQLLIGRSSAEAVAIFAAAVTNANKIYPHSNIESISIRSMLANALAQNGQKIEAVALVDDLIESLRKKIAEESILNASSDLRTSTGSSTFNRPLKVLYDVAGDDPVNAARVFTLMQLLEGFRRSANIAWRSAARLAANDPAIRALADEQRAGQAELTLLRRDFVKAADPGAIAARIEAAQARLVELNARIVSRDPAFAALAGRLDVPLASLIGGDQPLLRAKEALLVFRQDQNGLLALVITPDSPHMIRLPNSKAADLAALVGAVRKSLELDQALTANDLPAFDLAAAHELHNRVFAPLLPYLSTVTSLHVVSDGPVARLPLALLVAKPGLAKDANARYRRTKWLGDRFALVSHPGIVAFAAARSIGSPSRADRPVLAVADPALTGTMQVAGLSGFARLRGDTRGAALATRNA